MTRDYYDTTEVAERLGVKLYDIQQMLRDGIMPGIKMGNKWIIPKKRFERWLKEHENSVRKP